MVCDDDYADQIRDTYHANVVAAPRTGLGPFEVLLQLGKTVEARGKLKNYLIPIEGGAAFDPPTIRANDVAALSGKTSSKVNADVGVKLAGAFLSALSGVPLPEVDVTSNVWSGAKKFTFETLSVTERAVDLGEFGRALSGQRIDRTNTAADVFWQAAAAEMRVVTRALTSGKVSIVAHDEHGQDINLDVEALEGYIGGADAGFSWKKTSDTKVVFEGQKPATFAVSSVRLYLTRDGDISIGTSGGGQMMLDASQPTPLAEDPLAFPAESDDLVDVVITPESELAAQ